MGVRKKSIVTSALWLGLFGLGQSCFAQPSKAPQPRLVCGNPSTSLQAIQGTQSQSALLGQEVEIQAQISATMRGGLGGIFVEQRQGLQATGLFIQLAGQRHRVLKLGEIIRVRGTVIEIGERSSTLTALKPTQSIERCGTAKLTAPISLQKAPADWEQLEGLRVRIDTPLTLVSNAELLQFGSLEVSFAGRLFAPTQISLPGASAKQQLASNWQSRIILDDASRARFPSSLWFLPSAISAQTPWRVGTTISKAEGVVDQRYGRYRIQLTQPILGNQANRPSLKPKSAQQIRVLVINAQNFFNGNDSGSFTNSRGAQNAAQFQMQLRKLSALVLATSADIIALSEIENDGYDSQSAIATLTDELNRLSAATRPFSYIRTDKKQLGSQATAVAMIYKLSRLRSVEKSQYRWQAPFNQLHRVPLAQTFVAIEGGQPFTIIAVHLKSKALCENAKQTNKDQADGQGCFNAARLQAVKSLAQWQTENSHNPHWQQVLLVGDLNAYAQEDPLRYLRSHGFIDLAAQFNSYSYVYDAQSGRLDYALANAAFAKRVSLLQYWHINADESTFFDYSNADNSDTSGAIVIDQIYRSSDHDPLIIDLKLR